MKNFFVCEDINLYLNDILNNQASEDAKKLFFLHIDNCEKCMQVYKTSLNIKNALRDDTIYLGEDFTHKVMEKISLEKRKAPFHRITKIIGPAVAVAACFLFIFAIVNKGLLNKNFTQIQNKNFERNDITNMPARLQSADNEDDVNSGDIQNEELQIQDDANYFVTATEDSSLDMPVIPEEESAAKNNSYGGSANPPGKGQTDNEIDLFGMYKDNYIPDSENPPKMYSAEILDKPSENLTAGDENNLKSENTMPIFDYFLPTLDEVYANENYKYTAIVHLYPEDRDNIIKTLSEKFNFVTQKDNTFYIYTTTDSYEDVRDYFNIPKDGEVSIKEENKNELINLNTVNNEVHMTPNADNSFKNFDPQAQNAMLFIRIYNENYDSYQANNKE